MTDEDRRFLEKLQATFLEEAREHLQKVSAGLIQMEEAASPDTRKKIMEDVYRAVHSLKGAARAVSRTDVEMTCQALESVFSLIRNRGEVPSREIFDTLHLGIDSIGHMLSSEGEKRDINVPELIGAIKSLESKLHSLQRPPPPGRETVQSKTQTETETPDANPPDAETVRVRAGKLDTLLQQAEELIHLKSISVQYAADILNLSEMLEQWQKEWARISRETRGLRQFAESLQKTDGTGHVRRRVLKVADFLEWNQNQMRQLEKSIKGMTKFTDEQSAWTNETIERLLGYLRDTVMLPCSTVFELFPRMVRDLARRQGKEAQFAVEGGDIEIDKRILDGIKDPLIHIVRNSIDHGIEKPEQRLRMKKPRAGRVLISVSQAEGNKIGILVSDDGSGVDLDKVKATAFKLGLISEEEKNTMSKEQVLSLTFRPDVSTSATVTDISGRGIGLSVVHERVTELSGDISIDSSPGRGTGIRLTLPLTRAAYRGVLIRTGDRLFMVPTEHIQRIIRVERETIRSVENRPALFIEEQAVAVVHLADVLNLPRKGEERDKTETFPAVVLRYSGDSIVLEVDEILQEQEVVAKSLGPQLSRVRNIAGAAILGSGRIIPILHVPDLFESAEKTSGQPEVRHPAPGGQVAPEAIKHEKGSILVVEDSITARMLLKNILEAAGYQVKTAVDGIEALASLKAEDFNLVVSDVDMPRMNGFVLTERIRGEKRLSHLPVILVTALESKDNRERGLEAGADAYIIKSGFDQENLLKTIRRLI